MGGGHDEIFVIICYLKIPLQKKAMFSQMSCNSPSPPLKKIKLRKTFGYTGTAFYVGYKGVEGGGGGVGLKKKKETPQMKIFPKTVNDFSPQF